jgi:CheY-like chemotaxis protein
LQKKLILDYVYSKIDRTTFPYEVDKRGSEGKPLSNKNRNIREYEQKVLVLDDDFDLASLVKQILQKYGFKNVFAFTDPLLALEHFRINHKDYFLIISDIRMPIMNGFEFVRKARNISFYCYTLPLYILIFITYISRII